MSPDDSQNAYVKWLQNKAICSTSCESETLIGASDHVASLKRLTATVACNHATVLITGESGTGKELVARRIHSCGMRRDYTFVPVNCGAIPDSLFESEVFGFEKGSFTGACSRRDGYLLQANNGTLFLDEVGDLSLMAQTKLLRVLEDRQVRRIGTRAPEPVNVRFVAATNRDLAQMVGEGEFREDLFYRLAVIPIHLLPLRKRREDVVPIAIDELTATDHYPMNMDSLGGVCKRLPGGWQPGQSSGGNLSRLHGC
jgi:transcriptional regulator with PAS, ATPase and Fis domain